MVKTVKATLKKLYLFVKSEKNREKKYLLTIFSGYFQRFLNFLSFKTNPRSVTQTVKKLELVKVNYFFSEPFENS